jgi:hypothetical protein
MDENTTERASNSHNEPSERSDKRPTNREKKNKNYGVRNLMITKDD